jgi:hypothetical protein
MSEMAHQIKAKVLLWRGEVDAARMLAREFPPRARAIDDLQLLVPALAVAAAVAEAAGEDTAARGLVEEVQRVVGDRVGVAGIWVSTSPSWCASVWRWASAPPQRPSRRRRTTASPATDMGSSAHVPPLPRPTRQSATPTHRAAGDQADGSCTTDRMFPSGSLNQATLVPPSSAMPLTVFTPGRS